MAAAQYKLDVGTFDGTGGSLKAKAFIRDVDNAIAASGVTPERMSGIVRGALRGEARLWIDTMEEMGTGGLGSWTTLKPLLREEFSGALTVAELATLESQLQHKAMERASAFYVRCQRYHLEEDADVTAVVKADDIYKDQFARRVKMSFMKGLRADVRMAMAGVDVKTSTGIQLLAAAKNAEILVMKKPEQQPQDNSKKSDIDALQANLSEDGKAILAVMERRYGRGGRGGSGRGGGRGRGGRGRGGGGGGQQREGGVPLEVLQAREKALCGRCNKWVKHRTNECYTNLDGTATRGAGSGGRGGGGRGGQRSYANAAGAAGDPGDEFAVYDYEEPEQLN
jgi:hypothetical protein